MSHLQKRKAKTVPSPKIDYSVLGITKGEPRQRISARRKALNTAVVRKVRQRCVQRDGYCRIRNFPTAVLAVVGECLGPSEWAHLAGHRRSQTRGMAPEERHDTPHTCMLCRGHHMREEGTHQPHFELVPQTPDGADGIMAVMIDDRVVAMETAV